MADSATTGKRFRAAIAGTGGIAKAHREAFFDNDVELVAVADLDETRAREFAARSGGIAAYPDLAPLLAEQRPDLVSICTPPSAHTGGVTAVLDSGAWAWCEKPPCLSLAGYDAITAAEAANGTYAAFVFQQRYGSGADHLRALLDGGELGRPLVAHCQTTWYRDAAYYAVPWRGKWETEGGGPAMGHGIHQMDLLLHLLGPWAEVRAMTCRLVHDVATDDVSTALVRFASGAMATVVNSVLSPDEVSRIRLDCADATVELTHLYGYSNADFVYTPAPHVEDERRVARWRTPGGDVPSSHTAQLPHVLAALRAGTRPPSSGADGRRSLEFVAALYKAALTGFPVRAGEIGPGDPFYASMDGGLASKIVAPSEGVLS
ncbi:Gfo/Idh/MocA family protein [Amycolatopsis sp. CA-230715]|uniref:Gfo/Idh/MocA family protein n=1 Tax=Amycolatopsis sp. CA-230715 TaxID=2745196 RepID=UPI001C03995F|nr:Gfo/Idh/MocA family oxidoreductase [Amycolatopsis sp. CA-230715]QWF78044.1 Myo-inositol 2-dehydrogenase [Amycolatopsis sp. CA-230715]